MNNKPIRQAYENFIFNLISNLKPDSGVQFYTLVDFVKNEYMAYKREPDTVQNKGFEKYVSEKYQSFNN